MPPIGLASAYAKPAIWPSKCYNATSGMAYSNFEGNYDYTLVYSIYANQVPGCNATNFGGSIYQQTTSTTSTSTASQPSAAQPSGTQTITSYELSTIYGLQPSSVPGTVTTIPGAVVVPAAGR
jgi:hypothetical protein